ncbi:MAG: 2-amino-4-hydroxy-6-hydroxymethyldihydropteridine diphosphokinase [Candidatus Neomarinimicrobiota bacterium]
MKETVTAPERSNVFLSIGSNTDNRHHNLEVALSELEAHPRISVLTVSQLYETEPLYNRLQPDFLNCAVRIATDLMPHRLLVECQKLERYMGRRPASRKNEPRIVDIDIIFYGDLVIESMNLRVPHRQYSERRFVLTPLNDIAPDFVCPDSGETVRMTFQKCPDSSRVEPYARPDRM